MVVLPKAVATRTLEQGSAPSPIRPPRQAAAAAVARETRPVQSLGWQNVRRNDSAVAGRVEMKPRIVLTPAKRVFSEQSGKETTPTRSSPRYQKLPARDSPSVAAAVKRTREGRMFQDANSPSSTIFKRSLRPRVPPKAKEIDGTADQPIDLDTDSDPDSPKKTQPNGESPPSKIDAEPRKPHWEDVEVDLEEIQSGCVFKLEQFDVWIGRIPCCADLFFHNDCVWMCSIRYEQSNDQSIYI